MQDFDSRYIQHRIAMKYAYEFMDVYDVIPEGVNKTKLEMQLMEHDISKYSPEEYAEMSWTPEAKLHHIRQNPHHWEYWVCPGYNGKLETVEMPMNYVIEMVCDWWSKSWETGNLQDILFWYRDNCDKMMLHPKTRGAVEYIMRRLEAAIDLYFEESAVSAVCESCLKSDYPGKDICKNCIEHNVVSIARAS